MQNSISGDIVRLKGSIYMGTNKQRFTVSLDDDLFNEIEKVRLKTALITGHYKKKTLTCCNR